VKDARGNGLRHLKYYPGIGLERRYSNIMTPDNEESVGTSPQRLEDIRNVSLLRKGNQTGTAIMKMQPTLENTTCNVSWRLTTNCEMF
jgi:hypothetical protein